MDYSKCIICQKNTTEPYVRARNIRKCYSNIKHHIITRASCGEQEWAAASSRLRGCDIATLLKHNAVYHSSCRKKAVNTEKLTRATQRLLIIKHKYKVGCKGRGRPPKPYSHNELDVQSNGYDQQLCFFCQTPQNLRLLVSQQAGQQLYDYVSKCNHDDLRTRIGNLHANDISCASIQYHASCWIKYVIREHNSHSDETADTHNEHELAAEIEFINLVNVLLQTDIVLSMDEIHESFLQILRTHHCSNIPSRKTVKQLLIDKIPNVSIIHSYRRNEPDKVCLKINVEKTVAKSSLAAHDVEMHNVFECAQTIRREILSAPQWEFSGNFKHEDNMIPKKLTTFIQY